MNPILFSSGEAVETPSTVDGSLKVRVRQELGRLLADPIFLRSQAAARLLAYLVDEELAGRGSALKETTIGNCLYGRAPTYDTKEDAVVRVNANRLRLRLDEYYSEKAEPDVRIGLNRGSYLPHYEFASRAAAEQRVLTADGAEAALRADVTQDTAQMQGGPPRPAFVPSVWWMLLVLPLLALLAMAIVTFVRHDAPLQRASTWSVRPFVRLSGSQNFANFSPDGKTVAFASLDAAGGYDIFLQPLAPVPAKRLIARQDSGNRSNNNRPSWSPDGKQIAYIRSDAKGVAEVWILTVATGESVKVISLEEPQVWLCLTPRLSWTNDGGSLITSAASPGTGACGLVAVDVRSHKMRRITAPTAGLLGDVEAAVSPSGDTVGFIRTYSFMRSDLLTVPLKGGEPRRITFDQRDMLGFAWESAGRGFYVSSRRGDGVLRIWKIEKNGRATQLTDGGSSAAFPAISKDGSRIVFTDYRNVINLLLRQGGTSKETVSDKSENSDAQISPDTRHVLYSSDRSGSDDLWISNLDGTDQRKLADASVVSGHYASWSADSSRIAFECRTQNRTGICIIREDGGPVFHLTDGSLDCSLPSWSHDGKSVYYTSNVSGSYQIYRQPLDRSPAVQMTRGGGMRAIEAVDGLSLFVHRGPARQGIAQIPLANGSAGPVDAEDSPLLNLPGRYDWSDWDVSRDAVFYLVRGQDKQTDRLYRFDLVSKKVTPVTTLKAIPTQSGRVFSVSEDGQTLLLEEGAYTAQLDLMERH